MYCTKITLKSGQIRWSCVADGPRDPVTGKRNQIERRAKTQKEARARVNDEIDKLKNHGVNTKLTRDMTFDVVASEWLKNYIKMGKKNNSVRIRRQQIDVLSKRMAKVPIGEMDHFMYQRVVYDIAVGRARSTVQGINNCAGMIFRYALRNKLMMDNPCIDIVVPQKRTTIEDVNKNSVEDNYLETHEIDEFLSAAIEHGMRYDKERFFALAFSGMRSGELCALQKSDLDFENNTISITKTLYNERNNMRDYELTPPKTDGSVRVIDMEKPIMDMLKAIVRENDEHKLQYKMLLDEYHDKDFVFARGNGYPFITKTVLNRMNRILDKTSIKKHATPHIFRHTHISMLTEAGVDLSTIMERVGHEDVETTMRVYTHVTKKMKKDASDKRLNLFGNILEKISL